MDGALASITIPVLQVEMVDMTSLQQDPGFEMHDLLDSGSFMMRPVRDGAAMRQQLALHVIAQRFSEPAEAMLQGLVDTAVQYCGADSAGVSLEEPDGKIGIQFRWIAVAGSFEKYLGGTTPRNFSPCGVCLDRWRAQHCLVTKPYYDFLGVVAEPILDGMLIPWATKSMRGTIWAVSHKSRNTFDPTDYSILSALGDLVSVAIRYQTH